MNTVSEYEIVCENEMVCFTLDYLRFMCVPNKILAILDQIVCGGIIMETNIAEICSQVRAQQEIFNKHVRITCDFATI